MVFSENKWENSLVIWLDQDSVESLSGIEITTLIDNDMARPRYSVESLSGIEITTLIRKP
jgi:hypothetical protein